MTDSMSMYLNTRAYFLLLIKMWQVRAEINLSRAKKQKFLRNKL